jgi:hypothetical protein
MATPARVVLPAEVTGVPSGVEMAKVAKRTARVYVPRIVHVDWATIHVLIGHASHEAWRILAKKNGMIRLRGLFNEHKKLTGLIMKKWCWDLVSEQLK